MSSKRAVRRRACGGKKRYSTSGEAYWTLKGLRTRGLSGWVHTYGCRFCGGFHIGHPPKSVRQAIVARRAAR